jgi:hypothetical protein
MGVIYLKEVLLPCGYQHCFMYASEKGRDESRPYYFGK